MTEETSLSLQQIEAAEAAYDRVVREDIEKFRAQAESFLAGEISDDTFRAFRLRRGVYGQRQAGVQMIRTKVPSGLLTSEQMNVLAEIADEYGGGKGHLTTRQNMQYHFVPLRQVPGLLHRLADVRMTTREACYNTVRNVTCSPLAGLVADEVFDVRPYAWRTALAFLHKELTDALPRKFKIAFATGGEKDDVATGMHDVGVTPVVRNEHGVAKRGFRMVIAGGLGPLPCESQLLDEFIPEERLVNRIEAVIRVFSHHGNRKNKNKARLKFVLRERGFDWLKETIDKEYADILQNGGIETPVVVPEGFGGYQSNPQPLGSGNELPVLGPVAEDPQFDRWLETNVAEQKQHGYSIVTVRCDQGNLTSDQMRGLARIATDAGDGLLRISIDQNMLLAWIPLRSLKRVYAALRQVGLADAGAGEIEDVVSCPGAYSCNLALTKSMNLGAALAAEVRKFSAPEVRKLTIKVSGCPNSCGQHWLGDIGFYGNSRKINGHDVPFYLMMLGGGNDRENHLRFGFTVQAVPARLAPTAVSRILEHYQQDHRDGETFREYVVRNKVEFFRGMVADLAKPMDINPEWYKDWGDDVDFSLQLGRGECAS